MYNVKLLDKSSETEIQSVLDLLQTSFNKGYEYYHWKHNIEQSENIEEYTFCIFDNTICISTLQIIINEMVINGKVYRTALLADGATHKDYRRLGLFEKLLKHISVFCIQSNIAFYYGTGNSKSRKAFIKLGFDDFFYAYKAVKKIKYNHKLTGVYNFFIKKITNLKLPQNLNVEKITINEYCFFLKKENTKPKIFFCKSQEYMSWRLAETTGDYYIYGAFDSNKSIKGVMVIKYEKDKLFIVDLICAENSNEYADKMLKYATKLVVSDSSLYKINCTHNNFGELTPVFVANGYKISESTSSAMIHIIDLSFKVPEEINHRMHYMRIDKNE